MSFDGNRYERFAWLFSPAASLPTETPTDQDRADAATLLLRSWQALPACLPRYQRWLGPERADPLVLARAAAVRAQAQLQNQVWLRVTKALRHAGIPYVALKSAALRWLCYPNPTDRCGFDCDIGVPKHAIRDAERLVLDRGFQPAQWREDRQRFEPSNPLLRLLVEAVHYELGFIVLRRRVRGLRCATKEAIRRQRGEIPNLWHEHDRADPYCYAVLDIHHGISQEITVDDIVSSARRFDVGDNHFQIPRPAWAAVHLIFKIYWEGVHNYDITAYQYADLCRLIPLMDADECGLLVELLHRWQLTAAGYFVLRRLPDPFAVPLPETLHRFVVDAALPDRSIRPKDQNDLGDMWGKIWGRR